MLDRLTDEMLERLEIELSGLISFLSNYIPEMTSSLDGDDVIDESSIILILYFLSDWLNNEERAELSFNIGNELILTSGFVLEKFQNSTSGSSPWGDIWSRFISGFYKSTNGEQAATYYFIKTNLIGPPERPELRLGNI